MLKHAHPESFGTAAHFPIPITVALPLTLRSPDGGCMIVIDQFPRQVAPVETTWSRVWYAAEAVTAGCIRSGTAGEIQVLNRLDKLEGGLMVGILDEPSGPAQSPVAVA
ncbi:MAG: hypothetical protein LQ344_000206 [Seirophora lacunosa]|nr:MAG: hypothetical protein LQ344_000206 [Seirophora lacunosa]